MHFPQHSKKKPVVPVRRGGGEPAPWIIDSRSCRYDGATNMLNFHLTIHRGTLYAQSRDAIRIVERDGWFRVRTRGSHRQYKHQTKPGRVTIAGQPARDLDPKTWYSILEQAGLDREDYR